MCRRCTLLHVLCALPDELQQPYTCQAWGRWALQVQLLLVNRERNGPGVLTAEPSQPAAECPFICPIEEVLGFGLPLHSLMEDIRSLHSVGRDAQTLWQHAQRCHLIKTELHRVCIFYKLQS